VTGERGDKNVRGEEIRFVVPKEFGVMNQRNAIGHASREEGERLERINPAKTANHGTNPRRIERSGNGPP